MVETWPQAINYQIYHKYLVMKSSIKQSYSLLKCMFIPMHVLRYLPHCITALIASIHDNINECPWYQSKKQKNKSKKPELGFLCMSMLAHT